MWMRLNSGVTPGTCIRLKSASTMLLVLGARTPNFLRHASWSCDMSVLHEYGTICCALVRAEQAERGEREDRLRHCIGALLEPLVAHVAALLVGAEDRQAGDGDRVDREQDGGQGLLLAHAEDDAGDAGRDRE